MDYLKKKNVAEVIIVLLGNIFAVLFTFITLKIFTQILNPDDYGKYNLYIYYSSFFNLLLFGPLSNSITRFIPEVRLVTKFDQPELYIYKFFEKRIVKVLTLFFFLLLFFDIFFGVDFSVTVVFGIFSGLSLIISGIQNLNRNRKNVALVSILDKILKLVFSIFFLFLLSFEKSKVFYAFCLVSGIIFFIQRRYLLKDKDTIILGDFNTKVFSEQFVQKIYNYSKVFVLIGVFQWLSIGTEIWSLQFFSGISEVGIYNSYYQLGFQPFIFLSSIISSLVWPILYTRPREESLKINFRIFKSSIVFFGLLILIISFFTEFISKIVLGTAYNVNSNFLLLNLISGSIFCSTQLIVTNFMIVFEIRLLAYVKFIVLLFAIFINFSFSYFWKLEGVIYGNILNSLLYLVVSLYVLNNKKILR